MKYFVTVARARAVLRVVTGDDHSMKDSAREARTALTAVDAILLHRVGCPRWWR
jgi:hypothetical protein